MATPWHLTLVGILSLIWNGFGVADYALTQYGVAAYVDNMPPEMKDALEAYPVWMDAVWAIAVILPLLGAITLLSRQKAAAWLFGLGLIFVLVAGVWNYLISEPPLNELAGNWVLGLWAGVVVIAAFQWVYARVLSQRGVLQ